MIVQACTFIAELVLYKQASLYKYELVQAAQPVRALVQACTSLYKQLVRGSLYKCLYKYELVRARTTTRAYYEVL